MEGMVVGTKGTPSTVTEMTERMERVPTIPTSNLATSYCQASSMVASRSRSRLTTRTSSGAEDGGGVEGGAVVIAAGVGDAVAGEIEVGEVEAVAVAESRSGQAPEGPLRILQILKMPIHLRTVYVVLTRVPRVGPHRAPRRRPLWLQGR